MALTRLLMPSAAASAFLNNTPIVAMLTQPVISWAERDGVPPSRFLMPLSYAVILGGTVTLLGSSTNLVVSGLLVEAGHRPFSMFELTPVGAPVALIGLVVLLATARLLLPTRETAQRRTEDEFREFTVAMAVIPGGLADGASVTECGLRDLTGVFLLEVDRAGTVIAPVGPDFRLQADDLLMFVGRVDTVADLNRTRGLRSAEQEHLRALQSADHTYYQAVVGRGSPLVGRTLKEADFRGRYQAAVVAIHRSGRRVQAKLGQVRLRPADTLLVVADSDFERAWSERHDFLLVAPLGDAFSKHGRHGLLVGVIAVGMVVSSAAGMLPVVESALLAAGLLVLTRAMSLRDVRDAIDVDVLVLIASSFGLGAAIESSGLADVLAGGLLPVFGAAGDFGLIFGILIMTALLTEVLTNAAAAALAFPIAMSVAAATQLDVRAVAVAVAVAASTSFLTPIGYQTNTMVYGPGGYRFGDYARLGAPLTAIALLTVTTVTVMRA